MSEQVNLLRTYNKWRRGEIEGSMDDLGLHPTDIGNAIDAVLDDYATLLAERERLRSNQNTPIARVWKLGNDLASSQVERERLRRDIKNAFNEGLRMAALKEQERVIKQLRSEIAARPTQEARDLSCAALSQQQAEGE